MKIDLQEHWGTTEIYYPAKLCAKIIDSMQRDGNVHLWTHEGKNPANNGLYVLLDELCEYWGWSKSAITIDTTNVGNSHNEYNVVFTDFCLTGAIMKVPPEIKWNGEKYYGMFIGRASSPRIRAVHKHHTFKYKERGLTSFNDDLFNFMDKAELINYFFHSGQTYQEMISIKPYSDIDQIATPPIIFGKSNFNWSKVYEKIAIEIVCETSTSPNCMDHSEKTWRPICYKRPFLLIGSPRQLDHLKKLGFRTFEGIIPEDYDQLLGIQRVDRVFEILTQLIESNSINSLLEQCADILEHNYNAFKEIQKKHLIKFKETTFDDNYNKK